MVGAQRFVADWLCLCACAGPAGPSRARTTTDPVTPITAEARRCIMASPFRCAGRSGNGAHRTGHRLQLRCRPPATAEAARMLRAGSH